jgi:hypothetical protein
MAIVHGTRDDVVAFSSGTYCHERMRASAFPMLRLIAPEAGHPYDFLPVDEAVEWLDAMSATDPARLAEFAKKRAAAGEWRDVAGALARAKALKAEAKLDEAARALNAAASQDAAKHLEKIKKNADGSWADAYLEWQDRFEFAPAAADAVEAYRALQKDHDPNAEALIEEARTLFRERKRDEGYEKYEAVVKKYYAAKQYRLVKRWLEEKK